MKNILQQIIFGRDKRFNGILTMMVVGAIALGCSCLKNLNNQPQTPSTPTTNQGTAPTTPAKQTGTVPTNSTGELPTDPEIEAIVQESIQDFAAGVDSSDFSTIYEKSARVFKTTYSKETLRTTFNPFITQKARVIPILRSTASMTPNFSSKPAVTNVKGNKVLIASGSYSTSPNTRFELQYWIEDKRWKLVRIGVWIQ
jgi:hypothetical protein